MKFTMRACGATACAYSTSSDASVEPQSSYAQPGAFRAHHGLRRTEVLSGLESDGEWGTETREVAVFRENLRNAVFSAHGDHLRVECEIPLDGAASACLGEERGEHRPWNEKAGRWAAQNLIEELERRFEPGRRMKDTRVRHHPNELTDAERGECPRCSPFHERSQSFHGELVQWHLRTVGVHEDVGVDRDHRRSSRRSYRALRSATSRAGGLEPRTVGGEKRYRGLPSGRGVSRARNASSTTARSVVPWAAA